MNSGRLTTDFRYLVIGNGSILFCADTKIEVEDYIQSKQAKDIAIYQRRYLSESVLCNVEYEDELYLTEARDNTEND